MREDGLHLAQSPLTTLLALFVPRIEVFYQVPPADAEE